MQGIVIDERDAYVKAAIVKLFKEKDSTDENEKQTVTYAETDEEGRFVIQELNPDEKYIIEIHVKSPKPAEATAEAKATAEAEAVEEPEKNADAEWKKLETSSEREAADGSDTQGFENVLDEESDEEEDYYDDERFTVKETRIIDSLAGVRRAEAPSSSNTTAKNLYDMSFLKEKSYLKKNNLW